MCFNSRTPCGVRPQSDCLYLLQRQCFNSRTPCGVRLYSSSRYASAVCFNSRTPCGVRLNSNISCMSRLMFQFTHPVWGATSKYVTKQFRNVFQFTHPVWGATSPCCVSAASLPVSIHAPRVGCDPIANSQKTMTIVSIHAPRVGCDTSQLRGSPGSKRFNSRTPCGVRHRYSIDLINNTQFQFTHPVWGATPKGCRSLPAVPVSIHAPRVGCDSISVLLLRMVISFNSRTPCGVRRQSRSLLIRRCVSIHAPRVGCDGSGSSGSCRTMAFQFTHPVWGATRTS